MDTTAKMVLTDWQRGRLPYFVWPPFDDEAPAKRLALAAQENGAPALEGAEAAESEDEDGSGDDEELKAARVEVPSQKFSEIRFASSFSIPPRRHSPFCSE